MALKKTMEKRDLTTHIARWILLLQKFDYVNEHYPGVRMAHFDTLSRSLIYLLIVSIEGAP